MQDMLAFGAKFYVKEFIGKSEGESCLLFCPWTPYNLRQGMFDVNKYFHHDGR